MGEAKTYKKIATIRAIQMTRDFVVNTPHGLVKARTSDYLCENMEGTDRWPVKKEIFEETYELYDRI